MKRAISAVVGSVMALLASTAIAAHRGGCPKDYLLSAMVKTQQLGGASFKPIVIATHGHTEDIAWVDPTTQLGHVFEFTAHANLPADSITVVIGDGSDGHGKPIFCSAKSSGGATTDKVLDPDGSIRIDQLGFYNKVTGVFNISQISLSGWTYPLGDTPTDGGAAIWIKWRPPGGADHDPTSKTYPPSFGPPTLSNSRTTLTITMSNIPGLVYRFAINLIDPKGNSHKTDPKIVNQ